MTDRRVGVAGALLGTAVTALCFYPGILNGDSNWQYLQGVSGEYNDLHPVVMAWLWGLLDPVVPGPGGMFLATALLFWAGLASAVAAFTRSRLAFAGVLAWIGLFPPVFAMLSQITKDTLMGAALLAAFACLEAARRRVTGPRLAGAAAALWLAVAVRHNGVTAAAPLVVWLAFLAAPRLPWPRLARPVPALVLGLVLTGALWASVQAASAWILGPTGVRSVAVQQIFAYDLVAISARTGEARVPHFLTPGESPLTVAELRQMYHPQTNIPLYWDFDGVPRHRHVGAVADAAGARALFDAWWDAVRDEPGAWLRHRATLFLGQLGLLPDTPLLQVRFDVGPQFAYRPPTVFAEPHHRWLADWLSGQRYSVLYRPWVYLAISAGCMLLAWRGRNANRVAIHVLGASSAFGLAPLFFVNLGSDFRYAWWSVLVALVQGLALLDGRAGGADEIGAARDGEGGGRRLDTVRPEPRSDSSP